jgi:hypothetical protein
MSTINRFQRGSGVYTCDVCERKTRNTGQSYSSKLCGECWELAGIENEISDGHSTQADRQAEIDILVAAIAAKGGKYVV